MHNYRMVCRMPVPHADIIMVCRMPVPHADIIMVCRMSVPHADNYYNGM